MKEFYCPINLFSLKQIVYFVDTEAEEVSTQAGYTTIDGIPELARLLCEEKDVYKFHLFGEEHFVQDIAKDIIEYNYKNYSENKEIEVEVN